MCRHHCNEDIGCSLYRINIDHKTRGTCYETPGKALIGKRHGGLFSSLLGESCGIGKEKRG